MKNDSKPIVGWCDCCPEIDWIKHAMGTAICPHFTDPLYIMKVLLRGGVTTCILNEEKKEIMLCRET